MAHLDKYRALNSELIKQVQDYKMKVRLYEVENMQLKQESMAQQQLILKQKRVIESFVAQNSQDYTMFLGHLEDGHRQNMTVVTEFVQKMLVQLRDLVMLTSVDNPWTRPARTFERPARQQPQPQAIEFTPAQEPQADTQPEPTVRRERVVRSLSPVARRRSCSAEDEEEPHEDDRPKLETFVTKRRRNIYPRLSDEDGEKEEEETAEAAEEERTTVSKPHVPACDPVTLPDGMLSNIPESSMEAIPNIADESTSSEEEGDEQEEEEEKEGEVSQDMSESESDEEGEEEEEEEVPEPEAVEEEEENEDEDEENDENEEPEEDKENAGPAELSIDERVMLASSTPNPRKRMISSRTVLSPVDTNVEEVRAKRSRTPMPRKRVQELEDPDSSMASRPRRRAAPQSLAEPNLRAKLRR